MLAQAPKKFSAGQGGTDGVAIRTRVRRQHKAIAALDVFQDFP
jgi:hypothetical protein